VSKQTVYKHFASKEALVIEIVTSMTSQAGDLVLNDMPEPDDVDDVVEHLREYAFREFRVVLTPRLIRLRRLVIGEVNRFPELAKVLYEGGSMRALKHSLRRSRVWPITISSRSITRCWRRPTSIG
jgi:AcrR family transcriptional regulator